MHGPSGATVKNWAGNVTFGAARVHRPTTVDELCEVVASSSRIRAIGSGHSFSDIVATPGELVTLTDLPPVVEMKPGGVRVSAGLRYGDVAPALHDAGVALANLGSLPHIGIAGAVATGTHGSGVTLGSLATAVNALELVRADGSRVTIARGEPDFAGSVVALGALGIVTHVTLDVLPTFDVAQFVYEGCELTAVLDAFDEVLGSAYSVSVFTDWASAQIWRKQLAGLPAPPSFAGGVLATVDRHPIVALSAEACTPQRGVPGPWHTRLPHFRLDFTPSSGDELQSEFFVPRAVAADALAAVASLGPRLRPVLQVSELRTVAADDLWLSPAYGRDTLAIHFTWVSDWAKVRPVLAEVEAALAPFDARPHWGKLFTRPAEHPCLADFRQLRASADPAGTFGNPYLDRILGPAATVTPAAADRAE